MNNKDREYKKSVLKEFMRIPGVGPAIAELFWDTGQRSIKDIGKQDPERLYAKLCAMKGTHVDRCVLYVFRCAVYYASRERHNPRLLKWWNWKGR